MTTTLYTQIDTIEFGGIKEALAFCWSCASIKHMDTKRGKEFDGSYTTEVFLQNSKGEMVQFGRIVEK